jgi:hypothetical protein
MYISPKVAALNLEAIAYKVCRDEGVDLLEVERMEAGYRAFLQIALDAEPGFSPAPTRAIDIFWHHHILDTQKYHADCEAVFGFYLHHFPYSGIFPGEDADAQAARRLETDRRLAQIHQEGEVK